MCYCEHCRRNFKDASGFDLPRTSKPQDPSRRAYMLWRQQRLFDLWQLWDTEARRINPNSCVIPNTGGGATSSLDMKRIGEMSEMLIADRQARRGLAAPWRRTRGRWNRTGRPPPSGRRWRSGRPLAGRRRPRPPGSRRPPIGHRDPTVVVAWRCPPRTGVVRQGRWARSAATRGRRGGRRRRPG